MIIGGMRIQNSPHKQLVSIDFDGRQFKFDTSSCYQTRGTSCVELVKMAIESIECTLRPFTLIIYTGDYIQDYPFCFSGPEYTELLVADFNFWAWPEVGIDDYEDTCKQIVESSQKEPEYNKLFWAGNTNTNPIRKKFKEMVKNDTSIVVDDVGDWYPDTNFPSIEKEAKKIMLNTASGTFTTLPDHCKYKYLIDFLGNGYSGRAKHLLHSGRPLFYQERHWNEYWFFKMKPFVHYIPVKNDLSDFYEKFEWAKQNEAECNKIAKQAQDFAKDNLRRSNAVERYKKLLRIVAG